LNTLSDILMENVRVDLAIPDGFVMRAALPIPKLMYNELQTTFVIVEFPTDVTCSAGE